MLGTCAARSRPASRATCSKTGRLRNWQAQPDPLTDRERTVLRLAAEGLSSAAIAQQIHLSEGTVRNYLSEAISKTGGSNRIEAARIARERGWL